MRGKDEGGGEGDPAGATAPAGAKSYTNWTTCGEGREVAKLQVLLALDAVGLAHRGEHLGLLHRVDTEVGLEVEVHLEHVRRIAGLVGHDGQDPLHDVIPRSPGRAGRRGMRRGSGQVRWRRFGKALGKACGRVFRTAFQGGSTWRAKDRGERGRSCGRFCARRSVVVHELHHVLERREVAELQVLLALDAVGLAHRGEHLGLLHGVDAEVGLEVEVHLQHVRRIAGLLGHDVEDPLHDVIPRQPPAGRGDEECGVVLGKVLRGGASPWRGEGPGPERGRSCGRYCARRSGCRRRTAPRAGASGSRAASGSPGARCPYSSRTAANVFGLLHGVDAEVGLEVELEVEHVRRIAGLLGHDGEDRAPRRDWPRRRAGRGSGDGDGRRGCWASRVGAVSGRRWGRLLGTARPRGSLGPWRGEDRGERETIASGATAPSGATRLTGPRPKRHGLGAGAWPGRARRLTRRTRLTTSVSAVRSCRSRRPATARGPRGRRPGRGSPGMRRVRVRAICDPKPAARWMAYWTA